MYAIVFKLNSNKAIQNRLQSAREPTETASIEYLQDSSFNVIQRYFSLSKEEILEIHCLVRNRLMSEKPLAELSRSFIVTLLQERRLQFK